ncbi:MAG: methyltransferase, partial [Deltaproteobacteria bacterium]|nr:methyltransferase [Deltaproteobacteria bacterium]
PAFSGMGAITVQGLEKLGWTFPEIHVDARKMAGIAASTFRLFGFECAVVPFDMGVEAEALGAGINFYSHHTDVLYPTVSEKVAEKVEDLDIQVPSDLAKAGRIPMVTEAIRLLKEEVGDEVVIGAWVLGPYTLAGQLVDIGDLAKMAFKKTDMVNKVLDTLDGVLIEISRIYQEAGADYITVREMGAGPDILSPRMFKSLIRPHLEKTFAGMESPKILHICGDTNTIVEDMALCGADGISVEQQNDVAESRKKIGPDIFILGNVDPYGVMVKGTPEDIDKAVKEAIANGVDAPWPGDDIFPTVPPENMEALVAATKKYGKLGG